MQIMYDTSLLIQVLGAVGVSEGANSIESEILNF